MRKVLHYKEINHTVIHDNITTEMTKFILRKFLIQTYNIFYLFPGKSIKYRYRRGVRVKTLAQDISLVESVGEDTNFPNIFNTLKSPIPELQ